MIKQPITTEPHNAMPNRFVFSGHWWLYILLTVLSGVTPELAGVVSAQAQQNTGNREGRP